MNSPLISIIIPVYNVENYIDKCIQSLLNQTYKNIEIVLVNDGSPDNSGKICDDYAAKDSRVKVIHKENGGPVSARNAGFYAMTGDWHMYVDSDDWIDLDSCEKLVAAINNHPDVDMVFFNMIEELDSKTIKGKWNFHSNDSEIQYDRNGCIELSRMTLNHCSGLGTSCAKLINSNHARNNNIISNPKLKQGSEDTEYALRAYYSCQKCLFINEYLYHYRYNPTSITKKIDERNAQYLADSYTEMKNEIESFERRDDFNKTLLQDTLYAIVTIAVTTFFNPNNKEKYSLRVKKFKEVISRNAIFKEALAYGSTDGIDKKRKFTILCIRYKLYFMIDMIATFKLLLIKFGYYKY
jgi:glycosyltransferase involved in cell wall biosynthesis